jgi:hypothetical protein
MSTSGTMNAGRNTPSNAVPNFHRLARQLTRPQPHRKCLELDEEQAPGLQSHQFATAPAGDQVSVDTADGRHPESQEPRGVHAEEAGGCYPERGQLHQVLASMYVHLKV